MQKAKQQKPHRYWESLTDDQLLNAELTTDDPESLENLVYELPPGEEEPYVEFKYDLRGSEREKLRCVHGNHPHFAGFVMRKGACRFFVGHICGDHIYGEDFNRYTADFNAAINRQDSLRREREIKNATQPLLAWMEEVLQSDVFKYYRSVRNQIADRMPWIFENYELIAAFLGTEGIHVPRHVLDENSDPESDFGKLAGELSSVALRLFANPQAPEKNIENVRSHLRLMVKRIESVLDVLKEVEELFQPSVLTAICNIATEHDNPKKRTYEPGMMSVMCKRDKNRTIVYMPKSFKIPSRLVIEAFGDALSKLA
jgi:hypothetical protein